MLEGLHVHNKINKQAKAGGTSYRRVVMAIFEYSKWDGSQEFLPQSADRVFDQLAEYLLQSRRPHPARTWTISRTRSPRSSS